MIHERSDEAAWAAQRAAQRRLSPEERLLQNDALTRLVVAARVTRRSPLVG